MLNRIERNKLRRRLTDLLNRLDGEQAHLRDEAFRPGSANGGATDEPMRPDDLGGARLEEEMTLNLLENEERLAAEIREALERLDVGTYGRCVACGQPIPARRLQAIPYTPHCITCARDV